MKKLESTLTNMVCVLTGVAVVMGGILAGVNHLTEGPISEQKKLALDNGIKTVMVSDNIQVSDPVIVTQNDKGKELTYTVYEVKNASGEDLGAAVESTTGGFGGNLKVLVGFDTEGKILGYTLLEHAETPGLGAKADQWFQKGQKGDIIGKNPQEPLHVSKDDKTGNAVDAITASTITSRAFLLAINNAYGAYKNTPVDGASGATKQLDNK